MASTRTNASTLDDALDQLAASPPRAFTRERSALAARLAKLGHTAAAAKVKARRAPTVPVWAVNRLARENPKLIERMVGTAERVGAAQLGRDTTMPLGAAVAAYREATDALLARLDDLLSAADVRASHQVRLRIQNTLMAAAADPKTRKSLRAGRLEQELAASGFDLFSGAIPAGRVAPARPAREPKREREPKRQDETPAAEPGPSPRARRAASRERRESVRERQAAARDTRARLRMEAQAEASRRRAAEAERLRPLQEAVAEAARGLVHAKEEARRAAAAVQTAARLKRAADGALEAARRGRA